MMKTTTTTGPRASVKLVRCGIYTRKSTEEGLDQEYNSPDAQRDAGEACVRSQVGEGWAVVPDRYDDGGFTGGNTDRPALKRLLATLGLRLGGTAGRLDAISPLKVLGRGYAIASSRGKILTRASQVKAGDPMTVRLSEGEINCEVTK